MALSGHAAFQLSPTNATRAVISFSNSKRRAWGVAGKKSLIYRVKVMTWTTPVFEEVVLCCEINSYVSAKL
ncbi:MAG: pyrroloquinoline quinone precursor peptide PqqA [Acidobacteriia bacterium]|nr:pyrroloquinoline quinone precursor peptide PqqA [Terriglobia bacterium]